MNSIFQNIIALFTTSEIDESSIRESYDEVKLKIQCSNGKLPSEEGFKIALVNLNIRDNLHISILQDGEVVENYNTSSGDDFNSYIDKCKTCLSQGDFEIILTIVKENINKTISVYYSEKFIKYLSELSLVFFFEVINKSLGANTNLLFEIQNSNFQEFRTSTIHFQKKGDAPNFVNISSREKKLSQIKNLCHCNILTKYQFIPDDFYPTKESDSLTLNNLFKKISTLYSAIFLFDVFSIESDDIVEYKLNGYKTLNQRMKVSEVDTASFEIYYQIYSWAYDSGNIIDKIGLSRNIISLNLDFKSLKLFDTTFSAIQSSYKIYQKENIKQYIEVRNKISDQLLELQNKADRIVDNFISDYKKSIFTVVSFFISVLVIRVVTKGDFIGGFSLEVTLLSLAFLLISSIVLFFTRREVNKQIDRYKKYYENLKSRYTDLLHESDIDRILNHDIDFNDNKLFIEQKRDDYTKIWIASLIILFLVITTLHFINNILVISGFFIKHC